MSRSFRVRSALASLTVVALAVGMAVASGAPATAAPAQLSGWLHTSGSKIKTAKNETYVIKAATWSGMEGKTCTPVGLTRISLDAVLANMAGLGFNTVRIPFSTACLASSATAKVDPFLNPSLFGKSSLRTLDTIVARAAAYQLNVVLVRDRVSATAKTKLWYTVRYSQDRWIADWKMLAKRYRSTSNVIGFDLAGNPGSSACWGCSSASRDWLAAATKAGKAIQKVNSRALIIVGGVPSSSEGFRSAGDGLEGVAKKPVKLATKHRVVYSVDKFSPTVSPRPYYSKTNWPTTIAKVWSKHWGYLATKNVAPVMVGDMGWKMSSANDVTWTTAVVAYIKQKNLSFGYAAFVPTGSKIDALVGSDLATRTLGSYYLEPVLGLSSVVPVQENETVISDAPKTSGSVPAGDSATLYLSSAWSEGWVAQVAVATQKGLSHWSIRFPEPKATSVTSSWGMDCSVAGGFVSCKGSGFAATIKKGDRVIVGVQVASTAPPANKVGVLLSH